MDSDALMKIFDLYSPALFSYVMRLCGDPVLADHVVGDVFANLLEQLSAGGGPTTNLRSYLFAAAYHHVVDEARYSQRRAPLGRDALARPDPRASSVYMEDQILLKQILHVIHSELTGLQQHVILLRFLEGCSLRETAAITGKKISHVKVIQSRAVAALRKAMQRQEKSVLPRAGLGSLPSAE